VGNTLVTIWLAFCACFACYFVYKAVLLSGRLAGILLFYMLISRLCFCFVHCRSCCGIQRIIQKANYLINPFQWRLICSHDSPRTVKSQRLKQKYRQAAILLFLCIKRLKRY